MQKPRSLWGSATALTILAVVVVTMSGSAAQGEPGKDKDKQAGQSKYRPSTDPSQYVGAEVCKSSTRTRPRKVFIRTSKTPAVLLRLWTRRRGRSGMVVSPATGRARSTWMEAATRRRFLRLKMHPRRRSAHAA